MMDLHLNLKKEYFNQILSGEKKEEFREYNNYWKKRLVDRSYKKVIIKMGYPKRDDFEKQIVKRYKGYTLKNIFHKHFGRTLKVFAIDVS